MGYKLGNSDVKTFSIKRPIYLTKLEIIKKESIMLNCYITSVYY